MILIFMKKLEDLNLLMDKNDIKLKKKENDNLQEIFYKGLYKKSQSIIKNEKK